MKSLWLIPFLLAPRVENPGALLEMGEVGKVEEIARTLPLGSSQRQWLEVQAAFYRQDYATAFARLGSNKQEGKDWEWLAGAVEAAKSRTASYQEIKSNSFSLRFMSPKDKVLALYGADTLEKSRERYGEDLGIKPNGQMVVEFYPSWRDFIAVSTLTEDEVRRTGTVALCKFNRMMVTTPRALLRGYDWQDTLAHEYAHYVIQRVSRAQAPVWLHEGLAKYLEVRWRIEKGSELHADAQSLLRKRLAANTLIPFAQMHPSIAKLKNAEDAATAFAEVFYFVKYLVEERGDWKAMREVLQKISEGTDTQQAITDTFGEPFEEMFNAFLKWLRQQPLTERPMETKHGIQLKENDTTDDDRLEWISMKEQKLRDHVRLGDLLREAKRPKAAIFEFEKALSPEKTSAVFVLNRLALAAIEAGDSTRARSALNQAGQLEPEYPTTYILRGSLELEAKNWKAAQQDFMEALRFNPFDPRIFVGLRTAANQLGDREALKKADEALRTGAE